MKKALLSLLFCIITVATYAQSPHKINYQAVARNAAGTVLPTQAVSVRFTIRDLTQSGTILYRESHALMTNAFGLFSTHIGDGTVASGSWAAIHWASGDKYLQVEIDATGGTSYVDMGTTQMVSVPYALQAGSSSDGWSLAGNAGTVDSVNFLGTTDSVPLSLRVFGQPSGRIDPSGYGTYFGYQTGVLPGDYSTAIGTRAMNNYSSLFSVALGHEAMYHAGGSDNIGIGYQALFRGSFSRNIAIGSNTLYADSTGYDNVAIGDHALTHNVTGALNVAVGSGAMQANIFGFNNVAVGVNAMYGNTYSQDNVAVGLSALAANTVASRNIAIGFAALSSQSYGPALSQVFVTDNVAIGYEAMKNNNPSSSADGKSNTAVGDYSMHTNTTGYVNAAFGYFSLYGNTTGYDNTAIGQGAMYANTIGSLNVGVGNLALYHTTGSQYNTAVGMNAGYIYDNGYNNVFVGANTDVNGAGYYNVVAVGQGTTCTGSSQARFGNSATGSYGGWAGWTNVSDERYKMNVKDDVVGLDFITKLRPVTYKLDVSGISRHLDEGRGKELNEAMKAAIAEKEKVTYTGFLAQQVEQAAKSVGFDFSGVDAPKNAQDLYGLRYAEFVVPLVKGMQEQQQMILDMRKQLADQQREISELRKR